MSHHRHTITQEFHHVSQQNKNLTQNLISITLNHEKILQENKQLKQELKNQQYAVIEATLRQKNLKHTLQEVQKEFNKLQGQYKVLYDWMRSQKKLQLREMYKKESQFVMDLAFIEGQSYRQAKKAKNQQISKYQQKIVALIKQNQKLKTDVLSMTSQYNNKIFELKKKGLENQIKLKSLKQLNLSAIQSFTNNKSQNSQTSQHLQIIIQNLTQKLTFYQDQNKLIKSRNQNLFKQIKQLKQYNSELLQQVQTQQKSFKQYKEKFLDDDINADYINEILKQNLRMSKQISSISEKYMLLTQTYPQLVQEYEQIKKLEENSVKFTKITQMENQISQLTVKSSKLTLALNHLQKKYLQQLKDRQNIQYKTSILIKRFNQMFIKMNPYFDIYRYQDLQLDQDLYKIFDEHKDYKQLKEYENKILTLKRQINQNQHKFNSKITQLTIGIEEKQSLINKLLQSVKSMESKINNLTEVNMLLKERIKHYTQIAGQQSEEGLINKANQIGVQQKLRNIETQVTVPLLENLIQKLQYQRQQLLKTIYQKDKTITKLQLDLTNSTIAQPIHVISIQSNKGSASSYTNSENFADFIKQNQLLQSKYDNNVEALRTQITKIRVQLSHQSDFYQLQVKKYQREYEEKLQKIQSLLDYWLKSSQSLKKSLQDQEIKRLMLQKNIENQMKPDIVDSNLSNEQNQINEDRINEQPNQGDSVMIRQPSYSNLQKLPFLSQQQGGNKIIGQSTVQNLTSTLKKYQHDMNEVLTMCSKISQQYSQLKKKLKNQQQLQDQNKSLRQKCQSLTYQKNQIQSHLSQKHQTLSTIQTLYNSKSNQCEQLKNLLKSSTKDLQNKLEDQRRKNQLLHSQLSQIKQKMYQMSSKPVESSQGSISKGQFQTIVVMHANKNKELNQIVEKNQYLQTKVQSLMRELNAVKETALEKKSEEISPLQRTQIRQFSEMLQQTNIIEVIKKANQIVERQSRKESEQKMGY